MAVAPSRPQPPRPTTRATAHLWSRRDTLLGYIMLALAVASGLMLYRARGSWGPLHAGQEIDMAITLVTADREDLACASRDLVAGYGCAFRDETERRGEPVNGILAPGVNVDQKLFFVSSLFDRPAVSQRYERERPEGKQRKTLKRFEAQCGFRALGELTAKTRWQRYGPWDAPVKAWVLVPLRCTVQDAE